MLPSLVSSALLHSLKLDLHTGLNSWAEDCCCLSLGLIHNAQTRPTLDTGHVAKTRDHGIQGQYIAMDGETLLVRSNSTAAARRRLLGFLMAVVAGSCYGLCMLPFSVWTHRFPVTLVRMMLLLDVRFQVFQVELSFFLVVSRLMTQDQE
eukprot:SAG31_NODE_1259_length_9077_cov_3.520049_9_plen_150_part_00